MLNDVVRRVGILPSIENIDPREVFATFKYDKKLINDSLHWVLLEEVGKPLIFPHSRVPQSALMSSFREISRK